MVKIADLEKNDVTVIFLRYVFSLRSRQSPLAPDLVLKTIAQTLRGDLVSFLPKHLGGDGSGEHLPKVSLRSQCSGKGTDYYPVYYRSKENTLTVCMDKVKDTMVLRENFIREMHLSRYESRSGLTPDENLMHNCFLACRESMKLYTNKEDELRTVGSTCAKHLFKYRNEGWEQRFSKDVFSRYTQRLLTETVNTFEAR